MSVGGTADKIKQTRNDAHRVSMSRAYQPVAKAIPSFFNYRLAKDDSANLTILLALSEPAKNLGITKDRIVVPTLL